MSDWLDAIDGDDTDQQMAHWLQRERHERANTPKPLHRAAFEAKDDEQAELQECGVLTKRTEERT